MSYSCRRVVCGVQVYIDEHRGLYVSSKYFNWRLLTISPTGDCCEKSAQTKSQVENCWCFCLILSFILNGYRDTTQKIFLRCQLKVLLIFSSAQILRGCENRKFFKKSSQQNAINSIAPFTANFL